MIERETENGCVDGEMRECYYSNCQTMDAFHQGGRKDEIHYTTFLFSIGLSSVCLCDVHKSLLFVFFVTVFYSDITVVIDFTKIFYFEGK